MENMKYCQSCGMPLETIEVIGTNMNGSKNDDYCIYCFKDGGFTEDVTMEEMIAISLGHMKKMYQDNPNFKKEEALAQMRGFFPNLKRWRAE